MASASKRQRSEQQRFSAQEVAAILMNEESDEESNVDLEKEGYQVERSSSWTKGWKEKAKQKAEEKMSPTPFLSWGKFHWNTHTQ